MGLLDRGGHISDIFASSEGERRWLRDAIRRRDRRSVEGGEGETGGFNGALPWEGEGKRRSTMVKICIAPVAAGTRGEGANRPTA